MGKYKHRYGFKAAAERYALEYREELSIAPFDPLCPRVLAEHLGIPVLPISSNPSLPEEIRSVWASGEGCPFSGIVIADGTYKEVHHNDHRHPRRQNADIAHELAHIIMGHDLDAPIGPNYERVYPRDEEEEAKWLGATLLLPKTALIHIEKNRIDEDHIQNIYGVSIALYKYRYGVTDMKGYSRNYKMKKIT